MPRPTWKQITNYGNISAVCGRYLAVRAAPPTTHPHTDAHSNASIEQKISWYMMDHVYGQIACAVGLALL